MEAGKLRNRATIEQPVSGVANAYNEKATTWANFATVWCSIVPTGPKENEYAKRFAATVSHTIETRYFPGVKPTMRVSYAGRIFQINGLVNEDEANEKLSLFCTEVI